MSVLVLKIGPRHCPKGSFRPKKEVEWTGVEFQVPRPMQSDGGKIGPEDLEKGDFVYIWTHVDPRQDGNLKGEGLKATARIDQIYPNVDGNINLTFTDVEFFKRPISRDKMEKISDLSSAISSLLTYTISRALFMTEAEVDEFQSALEEEKKMFLDMLEDYRQQSHSKC